MSRTFHVTLVFAFLFLIKSSSVDAQYNPLWIPDTLSGTVFNLNLRDTVKQFLPGPSTPTMGINGNWWGPTLFFNKGDTVYMNVMNGLMDTTTLHWHGIHLPAVMDGGPHQVIPPMTTWMPYFKVMNNAATYWYHPHLHMMTEEHVINGLGGLIIVRDSNEAALNLPRMYGIDDIPLVLSDRRFDTTAGNVNKMLMAHLGDTMMVNGTLYPEFTVPSQVIRFRILSNALERGYRFGFADSTPFSVIATDGGLLNSPVNITQTRFTISPGERVEILVNLSGRQGQTLDLIAYNSTLPSDIAGASPGIGSFYNKLGGRDFLILHLNIGPSTGNPVTTFPVTLKNNVFLSAANATNTRHIKFTDPPDSLCPNNLIGCGWFDSTFFDINVINYTINRNAIEIWELENKSDYFSHPFHIHDVQFYILDRNGAIPPAYERGWKDVVNVRKNQTVRVIAKFEDFIDSLTPYMYHCHILYHEDAGMMGQFVVVDLSVAINEQNETNNFLFVYPNPAVDEFTVSSTLFKQGKNQLKVFDTMGREMFSETMQTFHQTIKVKEWKDGLYFVQFANADQFMLKKIVVQH